MSVIGEIYEVIHDHLTVGDRVISVAMNHRLMYEIMADAHANHTMAYTYTSAVSVYQFLGYPVHFFPEIPDGEFIVVCDERVSIPLGNILWSGTI